MHAIAQTISTGAVRRRRGRARRARRGRRRRPRARGRGRAARRRGGRRARLSTSERTTSSAVPLAARPSARYTTRSITGSSGFISWAEISTAIRCSRAIRASSADDLLGAAQIEVRQRLVEQQQLRAADQRVRDQDPLLLAARQLPDARVGERARVDRVEHLLHQRAARAGGEREARAGGRRARARPGRARAAACPGRAGTSAGRSRHRRRDRRRRRRARSRAGGLQPEDHAEQRRLAGAVGADQAGELARADREADVVEHRPPAQPDGDALDGERLSRLGGGRRSVAHFSVSVETCRRRPAAAP